MVNAFVFDAYGTLFDVHAAIARHRAAAGPDADRSSEIWRTKQLEYTWTLTLAGHYVNFWTLSRSARWTLHLRACHRSIGASRPKLLDAYLTLDAFAVDMRAQRFRSLRQKAHGFAILDQRYAAHGGRGGRGGGDRPARRGAFRSTQCVATSPGRKSMRSPPDLWGVKLPDIARSCHRTAGTSWAPCRSASMPFGSIARRCRTNMPTSHRCGQISSLAALGDVGRSEPSRQALRSAGIELGGAFVLDRDRGFFNAATICCLVSRVPSSPSISSATRPPLLTCRAQLMASSRPPNSL